MPSPLRCHHQTAKRVWPQAGNRVFDPWRPVASAGVLSEVIPLHLLQSVSRGLRKLVSRKPRRIKAGQALVLA